MTGLLDTSLQLGLGAPAHIDDLAAVDTPRLVDMGGVKARQVACGSRHTIVLSLGGDVFAFGAGEEGQLGQCSFLPI